MPLDFQAASKGHKKDRNQSRTAEHNLHFSDDLTSDRELDEANKGAKMHNVVSQNPEKKSIRATNRTSAFQSQKMAIYTEARKNAKDIVTSSVSALEDIQAKLEDIRNQEVAFHKYRDDCRLPMHAQKESFDGLTELYSHFLERLGTERAEKINAASQMLKKNGPSRQDALKDFSKNARHQLEQVKLREKEAVDAAEIIDRIKSLLRV